MLGISKYDAAETKKWLDKEGWNLTILADGEEAIKAYGLENDTVTREAMKGIPHPATIIIDKEGVVRFVNVWINYRERTTPATILKELEALE